MRITAITLRIVAVTAVFAVVSCSSKPAVETTSTPSAQSDANVKRYSMHGKVLSVNAAEKTAKIDADAIKGWMGAMAMDYPVRDPGDLSRLSAGQTIDATVFVDGDHFSIGEIKQSDNKPSNKM
jgi:Cu/Ag efflux protein CusF